MSGQQVAYGTAIKVQIEPYFCNGCGIPYGIPEGFLDQRLKDHKTWYCPNGCQRHYPPGKSDAQKLKEAAARETALRDQLGAAVCEGEQTRRALLRDRHRFANGVCPCCTRSFDNVRHHMASQHPDYDVTKVQRTPMFECSCGREFSTQRGLHTHQGHQRRTSGPYVWHNPKTPEHMRHLSVTS